MEVHWHPDKTFFENEQLLAESFDILGKSILHFKKSMKRFWLQIMIFDKKILFFDGNSLMQGLWYPVFEGKSQESNTCVFGKGSIFAWIYLDKLSGSKAKSLEVAAVV